MSSTVEAIWASEENLLRQATRHYPTEIDRLLAPQFHEIGQSGRHWTRAEVVAALTKEGTYGEADSFTITERRADELTEGLVLITFRVEFRGRVSRRSSLWQMGTGGPMLLFQQGTPVPT
jgi:hypothetical protein